MGGSKLWNYYSECEHICFVFSAISALIWKTYSLSWLEKGISICIISTAISSAVAIVMDIICLPKAQFIFSLIIGGGNFPTFETIFCHPSRVLVGHHWRKSGMWVCTTAGFPSSPSLTSQFFHARYKPEYFFSFSLFFPPFFFLAFGRRAWSCRQLTLPRNMSSRKPPCQLATLRLTRHVLTFWVTTEPKEASRARDVGGRREASPTGLQGVAAPAPVLSNKTQQGDPSPWHSAFILGQISSHLDTFKVSAQDGADDLISVYRHGESSRRQ